MPRVIRKKNAAFDVRSLLWWVGAVLFVGSGFGGAYFIGTLDSGAIDVNDKIRSTDQSALVVPVLVNSVATQPNGGLRPQSLDQGGPTAPTPEPTPVPVDESASTTESSGDTTGKPTADPTPSTDGTTQNTHSSEGVSATDPESNQ